MAAARSLTMSLAALSPPPWALSAAGGGAALLALAAAAATWHFHRDVLDEKRALRGTPETKTFVMETCGGDKFAKSIATRGFVLSSLRFLWRDLRDALTGARARVAAEGRRWPDAQLAELPLGDGEGDDDAAAAASGAGAAAPPRLLRLHDLAPRAAGRPLVLNFGSWT